MHLKDYCSKRLASEWQNSYPKAATCLLTELDACATLIIRASTGSLLRTQHAAAFECIPDGFRDIDKTHVGCPNV